MANLVCPSNPPVSRSGATPLAYIINGGQIDLNGVPVPQSGEACTPSAHRPARKCKPWRLRPGIAYDQTGISTYGYSSGSPGVVVKVNQDYVNSHDGTTYTLLLSENTLASQFMVPVDQRQRPYLYGRSSIRATTTRLSAASAPYAQQYATTFMWANGGTAVTVTRLRLRAISQSMAIRSDTSPGPPTGYTMLSYARPASNHNGVCVFAFCGGNVRPINEDIDYRVFKQLMTPFGGTTNAGTGIIWLRRLRQHHHGPFRRQLLARAITPRSQSQRLC